MPVDEERLRRAVVAGLRISRERYRPDLKLGDLDEWDSLGHLELVAQIESEFGVSWDMDEIPKLTSLDVIRERLRALSSTNEP
jgi:acyl carrier protein